MPTNDGLQYNKQYTPNKPCIKVKTQNLKNFDAEYIIMHVS